MSKFKFWTVSNTLSIDFAQSFGFHTLPDRHDVKVYPIHLHLKERQLLQYWHSLLPFGFHQIQNASLFQLRTFCNTRLKSSVCFKSPSNITNSSPPRSGQLYPFTDNTAKPLCDFFLIVNLLPHVRN